MKNNARKTLISLIALAAFVVGAFLASGIVSHASAAHAQSHTTRLAEIKTPGVDPWGTTFDAKGRVWVAIPGCDPEPNCASGTAAGKLAIYNPATHNWAKTISLPSGFGQPLFLAFDAKGQLWFPMPMTNSLGRYNPATNSFRQWAVPTSGAGPWDIAIDGNGRIWFTEHYTNKIGVFNPANQTFHEIATPASNSLPYGITVDAYNNVWFTENNAAVALIGEYTARGVLKEYKIRTTITKVLTPHLIVVAPNGNIWWSEGFASAIGTLNVSQAKPGTNRGVHEYHYTLTCASCGSHTSGIDIDQNGKIWFDDALQGSVLSFTPGRGSFNIFKTSGTNSHPHDGLHVDARNRVWFDEEFAGKLGSIS